MSDKIIRKEIKSVLFEIMQQQHPSYPIDGNDSTFPYERGDDIVRLPEDINTSEDYVLDWGEVSENKDLYGFPMEEFVKGVYVEREKKSNFNILDIAEIVINKLRENKQFYSNLGV